MSDTGYVAKEDDLDGPPGWSALAVGLIAGLVLVLGLGGFLFGHFSADSGVDAGPEAKAALTQPPTEAPAPSFRASTPQALVPALTQGPTSFELPDLATVDFMTARATVRDLKLGWSLVFEGSGDSAAVRVTEPAAGTFVTRGLTVKIYVMGVAPLVAVPEVRDLSCSGAGDRIVDSGMYPQYDNGRVGSVTWQAPVPTAQPILRWNDLVTIHCG